MHVCSCSIFSPQVWYLIGNFVLRLDQPFPALNPRSCHFILDSGRFVYGTFSSWLSTERFVL